MLKEVIEKEEPAVYEALTNALKNQQVSSALLFTGPKGAPKKETALWVAESIFCQNGDIACENCETCRRVKENTFADLIVLDGNQKAISKSDVDMIQERFSKTALEDPEGNRVYIILNAENSSVSAMNSMLKFLEEPASGVTAILTTDHMERLLPTIVSRCTRIPFIPISFREKKDAALKNGIGTEDMWFLCHLADRVDDMETMKESEAYKRAVALFQQYLNINMPRDELLVDYDISFRFSGSGGDVKQKNINLLNMFFSLLSLYGHDVIRHDDEGPAWYHNAVLNASLSNEECSELIRIAVEEKDRVNRNNDLNLVMDQAFFRLEELNHERKL